MIFQHKYINSSYRIRGNNPRILIIINITKLIPILVIIYINYVIRSGGFLIPFCSSRDSNLHFD